VIRDPVLGQMDWEEDCSWWLGYLEFRPGRHVYVYLIQEEKPADPLNWNPSGLFQWGRERLTWLREHEQRLKRAAAETHLLPLYKQHWRADYPVIDLESFLAELSLEAVPFLPGGGLRLFYGNGTLLAYDVIVEFDATGRYQGWEIDD